MISDFEKQLSDKTSVGNEIEQLKKQLNDEKVKKIQAVNKLAEILNRKDISQKPGKKVSASELRKKEKEYRKLQQDLTQVSRVAR